MIAAVYRDTGASGVLSVEEVPTPAPGPGEVLVRMVVAGVNPTDWKARAGATGDLGFEFQVPGQDGAGVIEAVGPGVDAARVGERVWLYFAAWRRQWGTAAQYCAIPAEQAVRLPAGASFELGASLGIPALTAYHCLRADGPIEGADVLVAGGAGAVGHAAIELGVWSGARVISTVSGPEKGVLADAAGAAVVVNYRDEDAAAQIRAAAPDGVARIVELALGPNLALDLAVIAPHGVISTYAADSPSAEVPIRALMTPNLTLRFVLVYTLPARRVARGDRRRLRGAGGRCADHVAGASVRSGADSRRARCRGGRRHRQGSDRHALMGSRSDRGRPGTVSLCWIASGTLRLERGEERARPAAPAPPLQAGTLGWASAVGNQAVARAAASRTSVAREVAEEEAPEAEAEAEAGAEAEPEVGAEAEGPEAEGAEAEGAEGLGELPEELPE